ncbi:hypothetical protein N8445_00415 [bacterium]|nr:hypothetical protein [bacterium]
MKKTWVKSCLTELFFVYLSIIKKVKIKVMTKAEIIDQIIEKKKEELKKLTKTYNEVEKKRDSMYFEIIQEYFGGEFTLDDVYFNHDYGTTFVVKRPHKEYNYDKEMITLRFRDDWKTGEFTNIETSMYSTNDNSQWELERLFTAGEVAKVLLDHGDDIVAKFNSYKDSFAEEYKAARDAKWSVEADVNKLKDEKNDTYLGIAKNLLEGKGLTFEGDKKGSIDLRWDWTVRGITSAKILSKTASGKSANIEISTYDQEPRVYDKVRMSNINTLLWQYRDFVINA